MEIKHPTLLLDTDRCKANIKFMVERAEKHNLSLKPHFKTHQSRKTGEWFREAGISGITVSSIAMAEYFSSAGWKDITIAFPANILAADQLNALAEKADLTILLDNKVTPGLLNRKLKNPVNVLVELDAGSRRTGLEAENHILIKEVVNIVKASDHLRFGGFYSHFGHTYSCRGKEQVRQVFSQSLEKINKMMETCGYDNVALHIGDTPGCSLAEAFPGITALTPGNFVFYDVMQQNIGSCNYDNIAVAMACPVVSKNSGRKEVCLHGGAVHFSKDNIKSGDEIIFGQLVHLSENGIGEVIEDARIVAVSQEHGIVRLPAELFEKIQIGDVVGVLPIHSCLTAECMGVYHDFSGNVIDHL